MLDPLSALGIAAATAQFLEFGTSLFSYANEIRKTGSIVGLVDLRKLASDLVSLKRNIHKQLRAAGTQNAFSETGQALYDLATDCADVANELDTLLQKLLSKDPKSRWKNFRVAFSTIWHRDQVETLAMRLSSYREQLALRILALLNANVTMQVESLEHLERDAKEIIEVLTINHNSTTAVAERYHTAAEKWHQDNADLAEMRHEEVLAAIVTLKDGSSQALRLNHLHPQSIADAGTRIRMASTYRRGSIEKRSGCEAPGFTLEEFSQVPRQILDCLFFRALADRQEVVAQSYGQTFEWLYDKEKQANSKWTNFTRWLIDSRGCYWINGKAGSGKSTLMKFIASHYKTAKALQIWAGGQDLIQAIFYLWNAGSTLQKSCTGLLRSLLFQIVEQDENLIPLLFPDLCRTALAQPHGVLAEPTAAELRKAFRILMTDGIKHKKICLFVDGIDELDGDYLEVLNLLQSADTSNQVKIVLSSRPIAACVDAFSDCASLRLQDLTYNDLRLYVREKLSRHRLMKSLAEEQPKAAAELVENITPKATGVFLWVELVVRSVLEGLQNFDTIEDLQNRLEEVPDSLTHLYQHMFDAISVRYRRQGAFLFELVLRSTEVQNDEPLSVQQLAFAVHKDPYGSLSEPTQALTYTEEEIQCTNMEGWMRSRCCGLVEAQDLPKSLEESRSSPKRMVGFMHRTVLEFLRTKSVLEGIRHRTADRFVEPDLALLGSCLYEMKATPPGPEIQSPVDCRAWACMQNLFAYCKVLQDKTGKSFRDYVHEVDSVSTSYWGRGWKTIEARTLGCTSLDLALPNMLLFLGAINGLTLFLRETLAKANKRADETSKELLLIHCLKYFFSPMNQLSEFQTGPGCLDYVADSMTTLLKEGANVNAKVYLSDSKSQFGSNDHPRNTEDVNQKDLWEKVKGFPRLGNESWFFPPEISAGGVQTAWYLVLDQLFYFSGFAGARRLDTMSRHSIDLILFLLEQLILSGADVHATFIAQYRRCSSSRVPHVRVSAFAVLELFLHRLETGHCDKIRELMFERKASIRTWRCLVEERSPARSTRGGSKYRSSSPLVQSESDPDYQSRGRFRSYRSASTENMLLADTETGVIESVVRSGSCDLEQDASKDHPPLGKRNVSQAVRSTENSAHEFMDELSSSTAHERDSVYPFSKQKDRSVPVRSRRRQQESQGMVSSRAEARPTFLPPRRISTNTKGYLRFFTSRHAQADDDSYS